MNTEHAAPRGEPTAVMAQIARLAAWARCANEYIDEHNAPPPQSGDRGAREELIAAVEELSGLLQRYGDALLGFAERESPGDCDAPQVVGVNGAGRGTLLRFPPVNRVAAKATCDVVNPCGRPRA